MVFLTTWHLFRELENEVGWDFSLEWPQWDLSLCRKDEKGGTLHSNDILRFTENIDRTTISSLAHRTSGNQKNVFVQRKVLKFKYLKNAKRLNRLRSFLFSLLYKRKFNCKRIIKSVSLVLIIFWLMPSKN